MRTRLLYEMFLPKEGRADIGLGKSGAHRMGNDQDLPTKIPVRKGRDAQYNRGPGHTRPFKNSRRDHQDEARFPDEKFWDKNGDPIQAEPKGPPAGTKGTTHADYGADSDALAKRMGIGRSGRSDDEDTRPAAATGRDIFGQDIPKDPEPPARPQAQQPQAKSNEPAAVSAARQRGLDVTESKGWWKIRNLRTGETIYIAKNRHRTVQSTLPPSRRDGSKPPTKPNGNIKSQIDSPTDYQLDSIIKRI